jgi:hypothetical protein
VNWSSKLLANLGPFLLLAAAITGTAWADLITNGGFETGTFSGWAETNQAGGAGNWYIQSGTTSPASGLPVPAPPQGNHAAMADSSGPSSDVLIQSFTVAPGSNVTLGFDIFVDSLAAFAAPNSLDYTVIPNQQVRVDILTASATPFALGASVVDNVLDPDANTAGYVTESFNITSAVGAGGTFQLRFADVNNQNTLLFGVDAVSIVVTTSSVPEPVSLVLLATVVIGLFFRRLRTRKPLAS